MFFNAETILNVAFSTENETMMRMRQNRDKRVMFLFLEESINRGLGPSYGSFRTTYTDNLFCRLGWRTGWAMNTTTS